MPKKFGIALGIALILLAMGFDFKTILIPIGIWGFLRLLEGSLGIKEEFKLFGKLPTLDTDEKEEKPKNEEKNEFLGKV